MRRKRKINAVNLYFKLKEGFYSLVIFSVNGGMGKENDKPYREV